MVEASAQSLLVIVASVVVMALLWLFFERTVYGKALRATAVNRVGARLVGIRTALAGSLSLLLAAFIGALSGILISPITTIYYDTGFLIGLKGFVGAILGGMASYPLAVVGALALGLLEAYRLVLGERVQGNHRLRDHHPAAHLAVAALAPRRGGRGRSDSARRDRLDRLRRVHRRGAAVPAGVLGHAAELHRPGDAGQRWAWCC